MVTRSSSAHHAVCAPVSERHVSCFVFLSLCLSLLLGNQRHALTSTDSQDPLASPDQTYISYTRSAISLFLIFSFTASTNRAAGFVLLLADV